MRHLENMAKVMLATGLIVAYGYAMEAFFAWYSGEPVREVHDLEPHDRARTRSCYWMLIFCNVVMPQLLWFKQRRAQHRRCCSSCRIVVNVGMWLERFVIIVTSACTATSCPRRGACTTPTLWDLATFVGTIGLFLTLFFLFVRVLPMISIFEMRTLVPAAR